MPIVTDYALGRQLNHSHDVQYYGVFLQKAGDTATGTINFPASQAQGNALITSINAGTILIDQDLTLPAQATHGGEYLTTNGTIASWGIIIQTVDWHITGNAGTTAGLTMLMWYSKEIM
jgi:hypothetical protein